MSAPTKAATNLLGTLAAPAAVAHGGVAVNSAAFDMRADFGAILLWQVTYPGTLPTVATTIQPQLSPDGTNWVNDEGAFTATIATGNVGRPYTPPPDVMYVRLVLTNADTAVDVTAAVVAMATTTIS